MTPFVRNVVSFAVMTLLVFIGVNLLLVGEIATGPHRYISFGVTGWLTLHRYGETWLPQGLRWSIENVSDVGLLSEIAMASVLTGILSSFSGWARSRLRNVEPAAAPKGGPATRVGNSMGTEGPP